MPGHSLLGGTIAFYVRCWKYITVADPDLQIRGDHPDPKIKRGPGMNFFSALWASVRSKTKWGRPPSDPSRGSTTALSEPYFYTKIDVNVIDVFPNVSVVSFVAISTLLLL